MSQWRSPHGHSGIRPPVGLSAAKQLEWDVEFDEPSIAMNLAILNLRLPDRHHQTRLLAVSDPHSVYYLHALFISSRGLRLDDEAVGVPMGLKLGARLCELHLCICVRSVPMHVDP